MNISLLFNVEIRFIEYMFLIYILFIFCDRYIYIYIVGAVVAVIEWSLDLQLPMQSVPIATNVVSSNLDQGEVYSIM